MKFTLWSLIIFKLLAQRTPIYLCAHSLVPRSPPEDRPGTHCLRMHEIFLYIFHKKLRALPCPYAEDYTNQVYRAFFELFSSQLAEPRWDTTFQMWQYHLSKHTALQKGNKSICQKGPLVATEYFISLRTRFVAPQP